MKRCPITYEEISDDRLYSERGLKLLSPHLLNLGILPFTAQELRLEAGARSDKMSIQGVQPKLSAVLKVKEGCFMVVDRFGKFILKPQCDFEELPENEAITMTLAETIGIDVPVHGLLYAKDGSLTYFIKRFDRTGRGNKFPVEDFAQLSQESRETKYASSMEKVIKIIGEYCTFPQVEYVKIFKRIIFGFLTGNEDMHLKNFSIISRDEKVELSPAYDLVNSTIALPKVVEEMALPLNGKKSNLSRYDLIDYLGGQRLGLNVKIIGEIILSIETAIPKWKELIQASFLSDKMKKKYQELVDDRIIRIFGR